MARRDLSYRQMKALIESLRAAPLEPHASVAGSVMARLGARERRLSAVRWTAVVGTASLVALAINVYGLKVFDYLYRLAFHSNIPARLGAFGKAIGVIRDVVDTLSAKLVQGALVYDLSVYRVQIWTAVLAAVIVVVVMMYLMGLWLGKPKGEKPWIAGRSLHNGFQVL